MNDAAPTEGTSESATGPVDQQDAARAAMDRMEDTPGSGA